MDDAEIDVLESAASDAIVPTAGFGVEGADGVATAALRLKVNLGFTVVLRSSSTDFSRALTCFIGYQSAQVYSISHKNFH